MASGLVACELGRVTKLADELAEAGVTADSHVIVIGGLRDVAEVKWIGMDPPPIGAHVFSLTAPGEGWTYAPQWVEYPPGWNYTRDLAVFIV